MQEANKVKRFIPFSDGRYQADAIFACRPHWHVLPECMTHPVMRHLSVAPAEAPWNVAMMRMRRRDCIGQALAKMNYTMVRARNIVLALCYHALLHQAASETQVTAPTTWPLHFRSITPILHGLRSQVLATLLSHFHFELAPEVTTCAAHAKLTYLLSCLH